MANEIHSLKIGDVEYPIYSEGIKIDTSKNDHSSGKFLVVTGNSGNQTIGASSAITGNNEYLTISSDYIKHGCGADYVDVGHSATELHVGNTADLVVVGDSATELHVGNYGTTIGIGNSADEVNIGRMSYGVNIGNQCEGNVVIANGCVWHSEDEDGNEVVEKTTNTYIGENNNAVNIGGGAKTIHIGGTTSSATTGYVSIVAGSDEADATIEFSENEGLYGSTQQVYIKSTEEKASGDDIYSQLVLNGSEVDLISKYNSTSKSSIDMDDEQIIINNYKPSSVFGDTKAISEVSVGEGVDIESDHCNINLSATQGGINLSTQYLADDLSAITGNLGDINIQSSAGQINLNSYSSTGIIADDDLNLSSINGDVDITSENYNINITTLGSDAEDNGFITIEAERDANMIAHGNINIDASYGDGETTGFVNINAEGNVGISSGVGKVNILADNGISLETSNNNIDLYTVAGNLNITSGKDVNIDASNGYDINIGHNSYDVDISGNYIYIGNAGQAENTNNIYIESSNVYIAGTTKVYPYECTDTALNTGFSVLRPDNNNVGVVFCAPSEADAAMVILPKNPYNSTSNVVGLGNTSKRFGVLFVVSGKATNGFTTDSDERLKDFGDDITVDLDALATLRKSYYRWNEASGYENEKDRMLGMSAQEVQKIYPELVDADENGMLSMAYDRLSVVALAAIDKLHETNKELKAENDELKERLTRLENLVNEKLSAL